MKKVFNVLLSLTFLFLLETKTTYAVDVPNFPTCSNPQGTLAVSYDNGIHGIPGDSGTYTGSDKVYTLTSTTLMQCFCSASGNGIQTNWWKDSSLNSQQRQELISNGWVYIPDGSLWGLSKTAYFAKNANYSCNSIVTTGNGAPFSFGGPQICNSTVPSTPTLISVIRNGGSAILKWTKSELADHYAIIYGTDPNNYQYGVANTGNVTTFTINALDTSKTYFFKVFAVNGCMPSLASNHNNSGLGGQVLGLASTGGKDLAYLILVFGLLLLGSGLVLRGKSLPKTKKRSHH